MNLQNEIVLLKQRINEIEKEVSRLKMLQQDLEKKVNIKLPALLMRVNAQ
jgi:predicted  nucleic acid-binding Zn-ribbon protein